MPESNDRDRADAKMLPRGVLLEEHRYWIYIVASRSGTLYTGITDNLTRRVLEHKSGEVEGFATKYRCTRLVYEESFDNVLRAIRREKQLKGWRRSQKGRSDRSAKSALGRSGREHWNADGVRW